MGQAFRVALVRFSRSRPWAGKGSCQGEDCLGCCPYSGRIVAPPLQRGTVVVIITGFSITLIWFRTSSAAESRAAVSSVIDPMAVLDLGEAGLHFLELGSIYLVLFARGQERVDLPLRFLNPVWRLRMGLECLS